MALLKWAGIFFVIAVIAAAFGFTGIGEGGAEIAKVLFYIFLALFAIVLIAGLAAMRKVRKVIS